LSLSFGVSVHDLLVLWQGSASRWDLCGAKLLSLQLEREKDRKEETMVP
jgi:hypothetical protein